MNKKSKPTLTGSPKNGPIISPYSSWKAKKIAGKRVRTRKKMECPESDNAACQE